MHAGRRIESCSYALDGGEDVRLTAAQRRQTELAELALQRPLVSLTKREVMSEVHGVRLMFRLDQSDLFAWLDSSRLIALSSFARSSARVWSSESVAISTSRPGAVTDTVAPASFRQNALGRQRQGTICGRLDHCVAQLHPGPNPTLGKDGTSPPASAAIENALTQDGRKKISRQPA